MNDDSVPKRSRRGSPRVLVSDRQDRQMDVEALAALAERTLVAEGQEEVELSLSFVTPKEMADLHGRYMGDPEPTDVLSFPMGEEGLLGDVVVCPEVAEGNNPDRDAELRLLVVHGVLHRLGYDHKEAEDRELMWQRQEGYSGATP
jgi:probable rRNA maturation factor